MEHRQRIKTTSAYRRMLSNTPLLVGLAGSVAMVVGLTIMKARNRSRRYGDHAEERRRPANMFAAGFFPRRRKIDRPGARPLFERRQSAYDGD